MRRLMAALGTLALAAAVSALPVTAGGGFLTIDHNGEVGGGFVSESGGPWQAQTFCDTGAFALLDQEYRFALEFPLGALPEGAPILSATLSLRTSRHDLAGQTAIYGYAGDGSITAADAAVTGTPVLVTPTISTDREDYDVTSIFITSSDWAGFSLRQDPLSADSFATWDCPDNFLNPILNIHYVPPEFTPSAPPQGGGLPDAAMQDAEPAWPGAALGFGLLVIGSLGALAVRRATRV